MKPGLGKTAPGDDARSSVDGDKTAGDEPRTDDRHDQKLDDIRASAHTGLKACTPQYCGGSHIAAGNRETSQGYWHRRDRSDWERSVRQQFRGHYQRGVAEPLDYQQAHRETRGRIPRGDPDAVHGPDKA